MSPFGAGSAVRAPLVEVATYERRVGASLERVWENVHDWEHLPFLHGSSFRSIRCLRADASGWRADVQLANGAEIGVELSLEPDGRSYHSRTVAGPGEGADIWTHVREVAPDATEIRVSFLAPGVALEQRAPLAAAYRRLYTRLWDEDEAMMRHRQAFLDGVAPRVPRPGAAPPRRLGRVETLALPRVVDAAAGRFVVREHAGRLVAHPAVCPHWGASLADAELSGTAVVCPWHGYRFDLTTGRGPASQRCRMPARAEVRVSALGEAWLWIS